MLIKVDRAEAINKFPLLPLRYYDKKKDEEVVHYPTVFANYVLTLPSKTYKEHQKLLGIQLTLLTKHLGYDHLLFLGDMDIPWLRQLNTDDTFQASLQYLVDHKIGKYFKGALQVDILELPTFIEHISWLVRTNGIVQYIYFTDPGQNMVANICQYGNLHISTKTEAANYLFKDILAKSEFSLLSDNTCMDRFSKKNGIKGRNTTM